MGNWIPKLTYVELNTGLSKTITFDSASEGDPYNEVLKVNNKTNRTTNGTSQVQFNYNQQGYDIAFKYQSQSVTDLFKYFLTNHAYLGGVFNYYPSSDESDYELCELDSTSVKFERPIPDGSGDFEYNFKFKTLRILDFTYTEESVGAGRINETQFTIVNNQTSAADITGLYFDYTEVGGAYISYYVQRKHTTPNSEVTESGKIYIAFNSTSADWDLTRDAVGNAGLTITIDSSGQLQYESTNISGDVDTSIIKFRADTIGVAV